MVDCILKAKMMPASAVVADVRDDEEQQTKCLEVLDLLLAAGYFRAKIKGLSNFDKIVGGLVWCVESCEFDVDILLFQEEWSIGKKIALTERVVSVLQSMGCPRHIEPHQIQGLDYIHIFPVVQWLVGQVMGSRQSRASQIRAHSLWQYHTHFQSASIPKSRPSSSPDWFARLGHSYKPKRRYRLKDRHLTGDPDTRVELTLMEYGRGGVKAAYPEGQDIQGEECKVDERQKMNAKVVSHLVKRQRADLHVAADQYVKLVTDAAESSVDGLVKAIASLQSQRKSLLAKRETLMADRSKLQTQHKSALQAGQRLAADIEKLCQEKAEAEGRLNPSDRLLLDKLQLLASKKSSLKKKEAEFRLSCQHQMEELTAQIEHSKRKLMDQDGEAKGAVSRTDQEAVEKAKARLAVLRKDLVEKSRLLSAMERQLDAVPSRYELDQYQRRFSELENQLAAEFSESQRFVVMYNTLLDQKSVMEREVTLLTSVLDCGKGQLKQHLSKQLMAVRQSKAKAEQLLKDQSIIQDSVNAELNKLLEEQRRYHLLVKEMRDVMKKNEALSRKLAGSSL